MRGLFCRAEIVGARLVGEGGERGLLGARLLFFVELGSRERDRIGVALVGKRVRVGAVITWKIAHGVGRLALDLVRRSHRVISSRHLTTRPWPGGRMPPPSSGGAS